MDDRLFDMTDFGGEELTRKEKARARGRDDRKRRLLAENPPVDREEGWFMIRQKPGPIPFWHLIASTNPLGGVATRCQQGGSVIHVPADVKQMIACPDCLAEVAE